MYSDAVCCVEWLVCAVLPTASLLSVNSDCVGLVLLSQHSHASSVYCTVL